jgi:hypothetical protein
MIATAPFLLLLQLCPYPQVARYKGTGSTDAAENFTCASAPLK